MDSKWSPPDRAPRTLPAWARAGLREPLLHFFVLGLVLWTAQRLWSPPPLPRLYLTAATLTQLERDFAHRSGHAPTAAERTALLREHVDSELLYREALQRGLLHGDVIVRRRLIQKMEFLVEALPPPTLQAAPTDQALEALLRQHAELYKTPALQTIRHVFAARRPDEPKAALAARAQALSQRLRQGANAAQLGDQFARGHELPPLSASELDGLFGPGFAAAVDPLPLGQWSPPIPSSYGLHLVLVSARQAEQDPPLAAVRGRVLATWEQAQRGPRKEAALQQLWQKYEVRLDGQPMQRAPVSPSGQSTQGTP